MHGEWQLRKDQNGVVAVQGPLNHVFELLVAFHLLPLDSHQEAGVEEHLHCAEQHRKQREETEVSHGHNELRQHRVIVGVSGIEGAKVDGARLALELGQRIKEQILAVVDAEEDEQYQAEHGIVALAREELTQTGVGGGAWSRPGFIRVGRHDQRL